MASARDVSDDDVGLPAGLTPTAEGKVKRLVVVGESRDAKSTIINFLRNPEAVTPRATMETSERVGTSTFGPLLPPVALAQEASLQAARQTH